MFNFDSIYSAVLTALQALLVSVFTDLIADLFSGFQPV